MSDEEMTENDYEETKQRFQLGDTSRKILTFSIIIIVSFSIGCGLVGISMRASENSPRNELAKTDYFIRSIIIGFDVRVFNTTSEEFSNYMYEYGNNLSTFDDSGGEVIYNDIDEELEYMTIYYPPAVPENLITEITFSIYEKSQLNIIIFADGREVYNALKIRNGISIDLTIPASEIVVYVF
ncbi:MAG: hypothetical protein KGD59_09730 [Candidatus Heimdallarchaeota archaeon]|nr:hypothetical protein [Candidatus Heimdallarchaeota archaeon]MBY8994815.1 hypothetical protein [Candidatus Heimdallarchaeota archaeon]